MTKRKKTFSIIVTILAIVIVVGGTVAGLYFSKDHKPKAATSDNGFYLQPQTNPIAINKKVLGAQTPQPASTPATKNYADNDKHFSMDIPTDWTIIPEGNEVIVVTPAKQRFSIQSSPATGDNAALQNFLNTQSQLHKVAAADIAGHKGFVFAIDGPYIYGYAFLSNHRLYYLLGDGVETSAVSKNFRTF